MKIQELIQTLPEGLYDQNIFRAVFMAGAPGAGKTTIANKLFSHTGLKSLNVDNFWYLYDKMGKAEDYERHLELYKAQERNFLDGRLGLLIDGTARNPEAMADVKAKLEAMGYETAMIFVNTTLETSMSRVRKRKEEVGRDVDAEYVKTSWEQVQRGLGKLQGMFGQQFYIVDNNRGAPDLTYVTKSIDGWLAKPPSRPAAKEWIRQQQQAKAGTSPRGS